MNTESFFHRPAALVRRKIRPTRNGIRNRRTGRFQRPGLASLITLASVLTALAVAAVAQATPDFETTLKSELAVQALIQGTGLEGASRLQIISESLQRENGSDYVELTLAQEGLIPVRLILRGPQGFLGRSSAASLRTLFLVSGFFTGKEAVRMIPPQEDLVVAAFAYAFTIEDFQRDPRNIFDFVSRTPAQIAAGLRWISTQPWQRPHHLIAMGVSLGGLFLPVSLHIAEDLGVEVNGTILVCTGAHLPPVLGQLLKGQIAPENLTLALRLINNLMALHDPKLHVPFLNGKFLTVRADHDQIFPRESSQMLEDLLPGPTRNVVIQGPHIDVDQPAVILQTQTAVRTWVTETF